MVLDASILDRTKEEVCLGCWTVSQAAPLFRTILIGHCSKRKYRCRHVRAWYDSPISDKSNKIACSAFARKEHGRWRRPEGHGDL